MKKRVPGNIACFSMAVVLMAAALGCGKQPVDVTVEDYESINYVEEPSLDKEETQTVEPALVKLPEGESKEEPEEDKEAESQKTVNQQNSKLNLDVISLSGKEEDKVTTTDYSIFETERCVLLADKDITLPGNFAEVVEAIVDEIEKETGLKHDPEDWKPVQSDAVSGYFGFNPFAGVEKGKKIPIYLVNDREGVGYISWASESETTLVVYELMSEELWNSIPVYRDNPWRKRDYMDYETVAHEVTHTIVSRNVSLSKIMTEGIATHVEKVVTKNLSGKYPCVHYEEKIYDGIPDPITRDNAEHIFITDYEEISHADRGAEYTLGMIICDYMYETFGQDAFKKYADEINKQQIFFYYGNQTEEDMKKLSQAMKTVFGDDFFINFGDWYGKNKSRYRMLECN